MRRPQAAAAAGTPVTTIADLIRRQASRTPDATALSFEGRETSFAALDRVSNRAANGLISAGVTPQARVAILDKNSDMFIEVLLGAVKANAVLVPINARLVAPEIAFIINDARAEVLFVGDSFSETIGKIRHQLTTIKKVIVLDTAYREWLDAQSDLDPEMPSLPEDVCLQMYTSGTTGRPKGVQLTNDNLGLASPRIFDAWGNWTDKDILLIAMPLYHIAGAGTAIMGLLAGLKTVVFREFVPPQVIEIIERSRVTVAFLVPAMILALLSEKHIQRANLSSLRRIIYGASPIPLDLLKSALRVFKHTGFVQVYGLTETAGVVTVLSPEDHSGSNYEMMRSCGRAIDGVELRIVGPGGTALGPRQVGEVVCRTAKNMKGYWNRGDDTSATLRNGWLHSGDAGYLDENGYLFILDRLKDMIVSGGENVYPAEIESALFGHPDVAEVAVIGVPDERWGEAVKALVVLKQGRSTDADEIVRYAREFLAGYKVPKSVEFVPELPRNPSGKILKRELREKYWHGLARRVN